MVYLITFGEANLAAAAAICAGLPLDQREKFEVVDNKFGNKRWQCIEGVLRVKTEYTVFCDETVYWPADYLLHALAPFEDPEIIGVGTNKQVDREQHSFWRPNFINFLGCYYLDRHNMETVSTNRLDTGVWVISGRTCIYRTTAVSDPDFIKKFLNERFFFGLCGPLNADDDLFKSKYMLDHGKKLFFQTGEGAMMRASINPSAEVFAGKILRWVRGPHARTIPRTVIDLRNAYRYPWTYYAVHIGMMVNYAAFWDPLLLWTLHRALTTSTRVHNYGLSMFLMVLWILVSKLVKMVPHLSRNPGDILLFPAYVLFVYYMSFVKIWAMLTFWDIAWGSRKNVLDEPPIQIEDILTRLEEKKKSQ